MGLRLLGATQVTHEEPIDLDSFVLFTEKRGLFTSGRIQRNVALTLRPFWIMPVGLAMSNEDETHP